MEYFDNNFTAE